MLVAEDLLLLVTNDVDGKLSTAGDKVDLALGAANLVELMLMNRVDLTREGEGKRGRLIVRHSRGTGDDVLDAALEIVTGRQGKRPSAVITPLSKKLRPRLYERLAGRGVIRAERGAILGLFPTHRWPAQDARHEEEVRRPIIAALVEQGTADTRSAVLIAMLHALGCEQTVVDLHGDGLSKKQLRARAGEIAEGDWASDAVRQAILGLRRVIALNSDLYIATSTT